MLSQEELQQYHREGYLFIDNFYTEQDEAQIVPILKSAERPNWGGSGRFPCSHPIERGFADVGHQEQLIRYYLHPQSVELACQILEEDVLLRCGILVDLGTGEATPWHRDDQGKPFMLFMQYRGGAVPQNGCLRVIPKSHLCESQIIEDEFSILSVEQNWACSRFNEAITHPREVSLAVTPQQLILRDSRIWHGTYVNQTDQYRLLLTWAFIPKSYSSEWRFPFPEALQKQNHWTDRERLLMGWSLR